MKRPLDGGNISYGTILREPSACPRAARRILWMHEHHGFAASGVDVIVTRGSSGLLVGSRVAEMSKGKLHLIHVRKEGENSHGRQVEGARHMLSAIDNPRYLIVDDFVSSGETVREIVKAIDKDLTSKYGPTAGTRPECVGVLCYCDSYEEYSRVVITRRALRKDGFYENQTEAPVFDWVRRD